MLLMLLVFHSHLCWSLHSSFSFVCIPIFLCLPLWVLVFISFCHTSSLFFVLLVLHLCLNSVSILSCFSLRQRVYLQSFFVHVSVSSSLLSLLYSSFISFPLFLFFPIPLAKVDNNLWIQVELHFWNRTLVLEPIKLDSEKWEKS